MIIATHSFEIYWFNEGTFRRQDDGGYLNVCLPSRSVKYSSNYRVFSGHMGATSIARQMEAKTLCSGDLKFESSLHINLDVLLIVTLLTVVERISIGVSYAKEIGPQTGGPASESEKSMFEPP